MWFRGRYGLSGAWELSVKEQEQEHLRNQKPVNNKRVDLFAVWLARLSVAS